MLYEKSFNNKKGIIKIISYLLSMVKLLVYIIRHKPDIIHVQWLIVPSVDIPIYSFIQCFVHSKIVFTAHNILPHDSGKKYRKLYKKFYGISDSVIVHDDSTKQELVETMDVPTKKVNVIHHGILHYHLDVEKLAEEKNNLIDKYKFTSDKLVFSVVGIQSKYKGTDVLLEVWADNKELCNNSKVQMIVAGRCSELDYSAYKDLPNLHIEDAYITTERLIAILQLSDVVLLPYRRISQSGVLLSAIDLEKPFLVTNVGGLAEPLQYGDVGWRIDECSESKLSEILLQFVKEPEGVKAKAKNTEGWDAVKNAYSWKQIGVQTSDLYRNLSKRY